MKVGVFGSDGKSSVINIIKHVLFDIDIDFVELNEETNEMFDYLIFTNYTYQYDLDIFHFINNLKGTLIYNNDDYYSRFFNHPSIVTYGLVNADIKAFNIKRYETYSTFDINIRGKIITDFKIPLIGTFNIYNVLAGISICLIYKNISTIKSLLKTMPIINNLVEPHYKNNILFIKDSSHTPNSVFEVLSNIKETTKNNLIVIININSKNISIINAIASYFSDFVIFLNKFDKYLKKENYIFLNSESKALKTAFKIAGYGDTVLYIKHQ